VVEFLIRMRQIVRTFGFSTTCWGQVAPASGSQPDIEVPRDHHDPIHSVAVVDPPFSDAERYALAADVQEAAGHADHASNL